MILYTLYKCTFILYNASLITCGVHLIWLCYRAFNIIIHYFTSLYISVCKYTYPIVPEDRKDPITCGMYTRYVAELVEGWPIGAFNSLLQHIDLCAKAVPVGDQRQKLQWVNSFVCWHCENILESWHTFILKHDNASVFWFLTGRLTSFFLLKSC